MSTVTQDQEDALYKRLADYIAGGGDTTCSRRAVIGCWEFMDRLQAIFNGPIPQQAPSKHGALLREGEQRASH